MSASTVLILVLVAAVLAVFIGQKFKVNMGVVAFVFGAILAVYFCGIRYSAYYAFWPTKVMLQLLGISFFFGFFEETGTVKYIASHILHAIRGKVKLLPFILPLISFGFGLLGISGLAYNTLLLPIVVALSLSCNRHPFFLLGCYGIGIPAGMCSPLGPAGVIGGGVLSGVIGVDAAAAVMPRVYLNVGLWSLVCLIIIYIIFRGWKIQVKTEDISFLTEKPAKATKEQVLVMVIMAVCVLFLVLPGLIGFKAFGNKGDIGFIYMLAGIVCSLLKLGDGKKILQKNIPWGIIIMVGGFAALLGVATNTGSVELLSNFLNSSVSPRLAAPLFGAACGIISIFSDAMGVVIPTFVPVAGQMGMAGAISTAALVTAVIGGGMATACAPLSTGGAQFVAYVPERLGKTVFWSQMAVAFGGLIVFILMAFLGIFG